MQCRFRSSSLPQEVLFRLLPAEVDNTSQTCTGTGSYREGSCSLFLVPVWFFSILTPLFLFQKFWQDSIVSCHVMFLIPKNKRVLHIFTATCCISRPDSCKATQLKADNVSLWHSRRCWGLVFDPELKYSLCWPLCDPRVLVSPKSYLYDEVQWTDD